jgi:hypothetical protein
MLMTAARRSCERVAAKWIGVAALRVIVHANAG